MTDSTPPGRQADALRVAIERTMSSLGERSPASAAKLPPTLASYASRLVDEIAQRGQEARAGVARRGLDAIDASAALTARVLEAVSETLRRNSRRKLDGE